MDTLPYDIKLQILEKVTSKKTLLILILNSKGFFSRISGE
jgi:hypothetical protein